MFFILPGWIIKIRSKFLIFYVTTVKKQSVIPLLIE